MSPSATRTQTQTAVANSGVCSRMPKLQSWARITLAVACLTGAIVIAGEVGRHLAGAWEWAVPPLVAVTILVMLDEIVHRLNRAIGIAIERRRSEISGEIYAQQQVAVAPPSPTQEGY